MLLEARVRLNFWREWHERFMMNCEVESTLGMLSKNYRYREPTIAYGERTAGGSFCLSGKVSAALVSHSFVTTLCSGKCKVRERVLLLEMFCLTIM